MQSKYIPWILGAFVILIGGYYAYKTYTPSPDVVAQPETQVRMMQPLSTLALETQSGLGQSGVATFTQDDTGKVVVTLALMGGTFPDPQPAHIHVGSCPTPGAVKYPLSDVVNGNSVTTLPVTWDEVMALPDRLALNVHKSAKEASVYTACGNLPDGAAMLDSEEEAVTAVKAVETQTAPTEKDKGSSMKSEKAGGKR